MLCLVVWGLSSATVSSWHNKPHSLEREIKSSGRSAAAYINGGVIENGYTCNPLTLWTVGAHFRWHTVFRWRTLQTTTNITGKGTITLNCLLCLRSIGTCNAAVGMAGTLWLTWQCSKQLFLPDPMLLDELGFSGGKLNKQFHEHRVFLESPWSMYNAFPFKHFYRSVTMCCYYTINSIMWTSNSCTLFWQGESKEMYKHPIRLHLTLFFLEYIYIYTGCTVHLIVRKSIHMYTKPKYFFSPESVKVTSVWELIIISSKSWHRLGH